MVGVLTPGALILKVLVMCAVSLEMVSGVLLLDIQLKQMVLGLSLIPM
jgi:hypothetical protein